MKDNLKQSENIPGFRKQLVCQIIIAVFILCGAVSISVRAQTITLDEDTAAELIEQFTADLENAVEDEDAVESIKEKWEARDLAGKTKSQAITLLFADVKSVVDDEEILSGLQTKWLKGQSASKNNAANKSKEEPEEEPEEEPQRPAKVPAQPQNGTLDEESVSQLVEQLTTDLQEAVEDEDTVTEITDKWGEQDLDGKTKSQAINLLLADVKSVIDDAEIISGLQKKWLGQAKGQAPSSTAKVTPPPAQPQNERPAQPNNPAGKQSADSLDEDAAAELIEKLTADLQESVEDEDQIGEITDKWNERDLTGNTRSQAISMLLADVKSVVEDEEIVNGLQAKWLKGQPAAANNNVAIQQQPKNSSLPNHSVNAAKRPQRNKLEQPEVKIPVGVPMNPPPIPTPSTNGTIVVTEVPIQMTPTTGNTTQPNNTPLKVGGIEILAPGSEIKGPPVTFNPQNKLLCTATSLTQKECGTTKADWVGKHKLSITCEKGFYDPIWGGTCWDFPPDDGRGKWLRGNGKVTDPDAVFRAPKESLTSAQRGKKTALAWECKGNSFWDIYQGGGCWTCPESYPRRTANAVYSDKACATPVNETNEATFLKYNGCPEPNAAKMGLQGKRMPGKPFLDIGAGGCYVCPNADEEGNILVTERNDLEPVNGGRGCRIVFKWKPKDFVEPGLYGLDGVDDMILEYHLLDDPDIMTDYMTELAKQKGLQPGTTESRQYVAQLWQELSDNPYQSKALGGLLYGFMQVALLKQENSRTEGEKKLIGSFEDYIKSRRTYVAQQALDMYDSWFRANELSRQRRKQSSTERFFYYGTVPWNFQSALTAGLGLSTIGVGTAGLAMTANVRAVAVAKYLSDLKAANPDHIASDGVRSAARVWTNMHKVLRTLQVQDLIISLRALRTISLMTQLAAVGPQIVIEVVNLILLSIAIDQYIEIQTARPKLEAALNLAQEEVNLRQLYDSNAGPDQMTYFWSKAMDQVNWTPSPAEAYTNMVNHDNSVVQKAKTARDMAEKRGYVVSAQ